MRHGLRLFLLLLVSACGAALAAPEPAVDHSAYDALLRERVRDGRADYPALKLDLRLAAYLSSLESVDPAALSRSERLAYWLNAYNAAALRLVAESWPVASVREINDGKPWDVPVFQPRGAAQRLTLNQIRHVVIRKGFIEPRGLFALADGTVSGPTLRSEAYAAARVSEQLAEQTRAFLRDPARNRYDSAAHLLRLSPIFDECAEDFGGPSGPVGFVIKYLPVSDLQLLARAGGLPAPAFNETDWTPNAQ